MTPLPSGTVTLLFSDIEGSTRLVRVLGEGYDAALEEHRLLIRSAMTAAGGVEIETRGDSFLFAFSSARSAVEAAVAAQHALETHQWPSRAPFRVRMGVHTGEPRLLRDGYAGIDVHRAARIGDAGHGGQIVVSEATRALVGAEFPLRELGEYRLAGLEQPERLYDLAGRDFPPLRAERREPPRRGERETATDIGWRIHKRGAVSLAGTVLAAARLLDDAEQTLRAVDRGDLAARAADHRRRAGVAPHVAAAADELQAQLGALDRLPERRRALQDAITQLGASFENSTADDLEDEQARIANLGASLESILELAPPRRPLPAGKLRRTRRRSIFRAGGTFVVLERDEHGEKRPQPAATLREALLIRASLRAARRRPHREPVERSMWETKSGGGAGGA